LVGFGGIVFSVESERKKERMELLNHAPLHLVHTNFRKASYIHIARDDLQRRDLFKPGQYLRTHPNQLPLLRFRTQTTCYIPSHRHLANDDTYIPYDQRCCPSCLPTKSWVTNSTPPWTALTPPPSPHPLCTALPAPFADMTSAPGPPTLTSNKQLFSSALFPLSSFANTTKHGPTLPWLCVHNSSTQSNTTFSNTKHQPLPGPYHRSPTLMAALPPRKTLIFFFLNLSEFTILTPVFLGFIVILAMFVSVTCLLLCVLLCCFLLPLFVNSRLQIHCGSTLRPGARGLSHYCTPLVYVPKIQGRLAVWRLNQPKPEPKTSPNWVAKKSLPRVFGFILFLYWETWYQSPPSPRVFFIPASRCCYLNCTYVCWVTGQWSYGSDMCAAHFFHLRPSRINLTVPSCPQ